MRRLFKEAPWHFYVMMALNLCVAIFFFVTSSWLSGLIVLSAATSILASESSRQLRVRMQQTAQSLAELNESLAQQNDALDVWIPQNALVEELHALLQEGKHEEDLPDF